jgi:sulfur carrier protein
MLAAMDIVVNEAPRTLPEGATVADLLAALALPTTRVAVEVNRTLVRRAQHATHRLAQGDRVEVVTLVGGG